MLACYLLVKIRLSSQLQMKDLGEAKYILGIKLLWDWKNKRIELSQVTYIDKLLVKCAM